MGRRGPQQENSARVKQRGGWRAKAREKAARIAAAPKAEVKRKVFRMSEKRVEEYCRELVPGYDAWATAGKGEWFDAAVAREAVKFFHCELCHVKGELAGQGFTLEPWEVAIIGNLFGWFRADGTRRYRRSLIYVPRKNGKTCLCAGIILYVLFTDNEPGAEIYGAASEYRQASLVFAHAAGMVKRNERFAERVRIYAGQAKAIQMLDHPENVDDLSVYRVISREAYSSHGYNMHLGVIDELHTQPDRELVDALETATSSRRQPLFVMITTADYDREGSICNEKHDYAKKVRDGELVDSEFLPVIYEASIDDDWKDEAVWHRVNPNLGISKSIEYMRSQCRKAAESVAFLTTFLRLELNVKTSQSVLWLPMDDWKLCCGDVDEAALEGRTCYAGLDLATISDLTALVLGFPVDGKFKLLSMFWVPDKCKPRQESERRLYQQWIEAGHIRVTPGDMTNYSFVRRDINALGDRFGIHTIAVDRRFQGAQLAGELTDDGFEVVSFGQGFPTMAAPTLGFEFAVKAHMLEHGDNPVLNWMASNVEVETDTGGCIKPTKSGSRAKIDGIVCAIMALALAAQSQGDGKSVYEDQGLLVL